MTGTSFNSELTAILEERDHVTILLNLTENGEMSDVLELDALRDRLNELERRARAAKKGNHGASTSGRQ